MSDIKLYSVPVYSNFKKTALLVAGVVWIGSSVAKDIFITNKVNALGLHKAMPVNKAVTDNFKGDTTQIVPATGPAPAEIVPMMAPSQ